MNTSERAKLTASIRHIERFAKSEIPVYKSEAQEKMGRRTQAMAKCYTLQANAIIPQSQQQFDNKFLVAWVFSFFIYFISDATVLAFKLKKNPRHIH